MRNQAKPVEELTLRDLATFPVWEFVNEDEHGETTVRPVRKTPVEDLGGRVVGTRVRLANGAEAWALLGNVDTTSPRRTQHCLMLSVHRDDRWFHLARYHDPDSGERGPQALATFLGLELDEVFPLAYDIRRFCIGESAALAGSIDKEPSERLTRAQIIALAVED